MADNPALIVRVVTNLDDLKKGLTEGKAYIETTTTEIEKLAVGAKDAGVEIEQVGTSALGMREGLNAIAEGAGITVSELGLFTAAGLVAATAMGAWEVGRAAAEFFDLDTKIGDVTAALLGFGDVAAETAGAKADVLAKASKHAGVEITDMATAMAINDAAVRAFSRSVDTSANRVRQWTADLAGVEADGNLDKLREDLASHNFSLKELATRYDVSVEAIKFFSNETKNAADVEKAASDAVHTSHEQMLADTQAQIDALKPFRAAMEEINSVGIGWKGTLDTIDGAVVEAVKDYLAAGVSQKALAEAYGLTDAQVKSVASAMKDDVDQTRQLAAETDRMAKAALDAATALEREQEAAAKLKKEAAEAAIEVEKLKAANRAMGNSTEYDLSTAAGRAKVPEGIATWLHDGYSLAQAAQIDFLMRWGLPINANDPMFRTKGPRVPGFEMGSDGFQDFGAGTLAMLHGREAVVSEKASGSGGLGATTVTNNFYVNGSIKDLVRPLMDELTKQLKQGRQLPSA